MESGSWQRLLQLTSTYGYAFVFLISVAENTFLLGLVVPGDVAIVLAGALSAGAALDFVTLACVVVAGVLLGANLSFWIGRRGGVPLIEGSASRFGIEPSRIRRVEDYFSHHGAKTVFAASFISGLKNLVPAIAGASRMSAPRFFAYNAAGSAIRSVVFLALGYMFAAEFPAAIGAIGSLNAWILVGIFVLILVLLVVARRKRRPSVEESGASHPDRVDRGAS